MLAILTVGVVWASVLDPEIFAVVLQGIDMRSQLIDEMHGKSTSKDRK